MMRIGARDAWVIARRLWGREPVAPGEVEPLLESERVRPLVEGLRDTDLSQRAAVRKGFLTGRADSEDWSGPVGEADPAGPPPPEDSPEAPRPRATLADVKRMMADTTWPWPGWLAGGGLNSVAA